MSDAIAADAGSGVPSTMDVMARLKAVPKGVLFVLQVGVRTAPMYFAAVSFEHVFPLGRTCSYPDGRPLYEWVPPAGGRPGRWAAATRHEYQYVAGTVLTEQDVASRMIPKDVPPINGPAPLRALSLDDWIDANRAKLDEAIAALAPDAPCL